MDIIPLSSAPEALAFRLGQVALLRCKDVTDGEVSRRTHDETADASLSKNDPRSSIATADGFALPRWVPHRAHEVAFLSVSDVMGRRRVE